MLTIFIMYMLISILFMNIMFPLNMILLILIQSFMTAEMMNLMTKSMWFSYILFLVFLGGMLVLFIYIATLASNHISLNKWNIITSGIMMMLVMILVPMQMEFNNLMNLNNTFNINMLSNLHSQLMNLYNQPYYKITLMVMIYLLMTLVIVINISNIKKGPLRKL